MKIKVYSKLSLDAATLKTILPRAEIAAPIQRGDLAKDIGNYNIILIIDGKFHHNLAVTCDEIRDVMACGIKVYGASSMGALRASELCDFGMVGYGKIYEYIKSTSYFRDDLLGQVYVAGKEGVHTPNISYMDFYFNLKLLAASKKINKTEFKNLTQLLRSLFYAERGWVQFRDKIAKTKIYHEGLLRIADQALHKMGSQKNRDAVGLCRKAATDLKHISKINVAISPKRLLARWA